jgi:phosphoglycolate phosphatase-like HAD superfamily hydrolase
MNIELVIFGFVGTTVLDDGLVSSSLREALASADVAASDEAIEGVAGLASPRAVSELLASVRGAKGTWGADEVERVHADFVRRLIARASRDEPLRETLGASRAFWQLRQDGIRVGSVTGLSLSSAGAIHERLGWRARGLVDVFVTSDEVERGAPEPDAIFETMQRAGVRESARVAFVGNATSELAPPAAASSWASSTPTARSVASAQRPTTCSCRRARSCPSCCGGSRRGGSRRSRWAGAARALATAAAPRARGVRPRPTSRSPADARPRRATEARRGR